MRPEFVEVQNVLDDVLTQSFALRSDEQETKRAQSNLLLRPYQGLGRRLDRRQPGHERDPLGAKLRFPSELSVDRFRRSPLACAVLVGN